ncbi:MAG: hypothetical protein R3202_14930, partial [Candidatus Competibacterales bacterium]|nr:hypothetical protein [Candidatus Competibacterales bacterium]
MANIGRRRGGGGTRRGPAYLLLMYIVISKPKRRSLYSGLVQVFMDALLGLELGESRWQLQWQSGPLGYCRPRASSGNRMQSIDFNKIYCCRRILTGPDTGRWLQHMLQPD